MSAKKPSFDDQKGMGRSKVRRVPDFSKIHQQWSSKLEQRKALGKKPCTIPLEFEVAQEKGTFGRTMSYGRVTPTPKIGKSTSAKSITVSSKSPGSVKFKASKDALNSILNGQGIQNEVTPQKSYSMYQRTGNALSNNLFKTPLDLPKNAKKLTSTTFMTSVPSAKKQEKENEFKFEKSREALQTILNEEGVKAEVDAPRHFSMYCRTGQPLNSIHSPSNVLKSARKTKVKTPQKTKENFIEPDVQFEESKDALMSILNEKGISNEGGTPAKYYSMYSRTGQTVRTPQGQSMRKSIYYHAATTNGKDAAQRYSRQLNFEKGKHMPHTKSMSAMKTSVAVPIRNSIYKNYCLSPMVNVSPSPRRQKMQKETASKSVSRIRWADMLREEESTIKDDLPTKLTFEDLDSPCYDQENIQNKPVSSKNPKDKVKSTQDTLHPSSPKNIPIFCDKDIKQSPLEQPKKGALCPRSPNVNTPPRSPKPRDLLHHNSPLKAVVSHKPRYYCPSSPRLEHQVNSATDLINKENMSPLRPKFQDKDILRQTESLKDDVQDLNVTLNESILKYDQLQEEADQLLSADVDNNIILKKLEKIRARQQKLLKMEEFLTRKLQTKATNKPEANVFGKVVEESKADLECSEPQVENKMEERAKSEEKGQLENCSDLTEKPEEDVNERSKVALESVNNVSYDKNRASAERKLQGKETTGLAAKMSEVTTNENMKSFASEAETNISQINPVMSTPKCQKAKDVAESSLVMPTPVRNSPASPTKRAYYFPAICTPLSMRDMAGQPERRRDSLGRSPDTPEDIRDSYSIDKSVDSSVSSPGPSIPLQKVFDASPISRGSHASPSRDHMLSPLAYLPGTPVHLFMGSPGSPVTLRGSLSLAGNINFAKPNNPGRAAGLLLPAAVHRYHDALLDDEVSLYMCRLKRSIFAGDARIQDPVAEVLTLGDEMHFIPVSGDDLLLGFSLQPLEGSAFSVLKSSPS